MKTYYAILLGWGYAVWTFDGDNLIDDYSDGDCRYAGQTYATGQWGTEELLGAAKASAAEQHSEHSDTGEPERDDKRLLNKYERIRLTKKYAGESFENPTEHRAPPLEHPFGVARF